MYFNEHQMTQPLFATKTTLCIDKSTTKICRQQIIFVTFVMTNAFYFGCIPIVIRVKYKCPCVNVLNMQENNETRLDIPLLQLRFLRQDFIYSGVIVV